MMKTAENLEKNVRGKPLMATAKKTLDALRAGEEEESSKKEKPRGNHWSVAREIRLFTD